MNPEFSQTEKSALAALAQSATPSIATALVAIVVGILTLAWPGRTLVVLAVLFGIQLVVFGVNRLVAAHAAVDTARTLNVVVGLVALLLGLFSIRHVGFTLGAFAALLGVFWVASGISDVLSALDSQESSGRGFALLAGVLGVISGVIVLVYPSITLSALAWILGLWLVLHGILALMIHRAITVASRSLLKG